LHARSRIARPTWLRLARSQSATQLMDLIFLVGCYGTLATTINSIEMATESDPALAMLEPTVRQRLVDSMPASGG